MDIHSSKDALREMTQPKSGQILNAAESSHSVDLGGLPKDAIKAMIEKLNQRSQKATRVFNNEYDLTTNDLKQLMEKVLQEFNACAIIANAATASVVLSKNQRFDFSSWQEFEEFDISQPQTTKSLSFSITLDVIRGENQTPERYEVQVSVQNNPAMFGIQIGPLGIRPVEGFEVPPAHLVAAVNFNNYILGKNILSTIEEWEKSLRRREAKVRNFFQKWSSSIRVVLGFLATLSGIYACRLPLAEVNFSEPNAVAKFAIVSTAIIYTFHFVGSSLAKEVERQIDRQLPHNNITLTEGDKRALEKRAKRNGKTVAKSLLFFGGVATQVICSITATAIWTKLKSMGLF